MVTSLRSVAEGKRLGLEESQYLCHRFLVLLVQKALQISIQLRDLQLHEYHHRTVGRGDNLLNHGTDRLDWARLEIERIHQKLYP